MVVLGSLLKGTILCPFLSFLSILVSCFFLEGKMTAILHQQSDHENESHMFFIVKNRITEGIQLTGDMVDLLIRVLNQRHLIKLLWSHFWFIIAKVISNSYSSFHQRQTCISIIVSSYVVSIYFRISQESSLPILFFPLCPRMPFALLTKA